MPAGAEVAVNTHINSRHMHWTLHSISHSIFHWTPVKAAHELGGFKVLGEALGIQRNKNEYRENNVIWEKRVSL